MNFSNQMSRPVTSKQAVEPTDLLIPCSWFHDIIFLKEVG
jgi:hypothetical protein